MHLDIITETAGKAIMADLVQLITYCDALVFGWILTDLAANALVRTSKAGAMIRFFGSRLLSRENAIKAALFQFAAAFIFSFFIQDFLVKLFQDYILFILPITLSAVGLLYIYVLLGLPYKVTARRCSISIFLFVVSSLLTLWILSSTGYFNQITGFIIFSLRHVFMLVI